MNWQPPNRGQARHTFALTAREESFFNLDYRQGGLGGNSCGPGPLKEYQLKAEKMSFALRWRPFIAADAGAGGLGKAGAGGLA